MYGGKKLPVLTLSSSRRKKKSTFEERVGRADKGFVRSFLCVYPHISIRAVFFKLILRNLSYRISVRDWKVTSGTIILPRVPKLRRYWLKFPRYADETGSRLVPIFFATKTTVRRQHWFTASRLLSQKSRRDWLEGGSFRRTKIER